tara:strand:- start:1637 stop:2818 length:1182 start_codon:yes stop_codon:yes gene_type:complete
MNFLIFLKKLFYYLFVIILANIPFLLFSQSFIPDPPSLNAASYILIEATTGKVIAEQDSDLETEPASLTKIMTGYVVADQLSKGFIDNDDEVFISVNCWKKSGSKMYVREGTYVLFSDLVKGMVVQSGNDASCAIAEHIAGSEEGFVKLMMKYSNEMGLRDTNFVNPHGWPDKNHYSSARDLATLSQKLISDFPDHYSMYKEKWFTYSDIKQRNRNSLLWQDETVDGIKTGHTDNAGYCLVASAKKNDTRLIAVTLNSSSERTRITDNRRLLDYGFRYFITKIVVHAGEKLTEKEVWGGQVDKVSLASATSLYLTLSPKDFKEVETFISLDNYLQAPLVEGQVVGKITLEIQGKEIAEAQLVTTQNIIAQGLFGRTWANIKLLVYRFLMEDDK